MTNGNHIIEDNFKDFYGSNKFNFDDISTE